MEQIMMEINVLQVVQLRPSMIVQELLVFMSVV